MVRGGIMDVRDLRRSLMAQAARARTLGDEKMLSLSVFSLPDGSAEEICLAIALPHARIRVADAGVLGAAGLPVVVDNRPPGHARISFSELPSELEIRRLLRCFGPPITNPSAGGQTR